jgi:hypothetical protein
MNTAVDRIDRTDSSWAIKHGIVGGVIAGVVFLVAEMVGSVLLGGELLAPFQAFASIPLGQMPPEIAIGTAIPIGFITHFVLSIIYGVIFALVVMAVPALRASSTMLIVAATIFGTLLWILNFFILPNVIGRPWFAMAPLVPQFVYHAFFYGTVLGLYFASRSGRAERLG